VGPYRISEIPPNSTFYKLEELDGTPYKDNMVGGNRIKKFFKRAELDALRQEMHDTIRVMDAPGKEVGEEGGTVENEDGIMDEDLL
jgi:hypothetical protein